MARVGDKRVVLDVRDHVQGDSALFPFKEQRAPMDDLKTKAPRHARRFLF